MKSPLRIQLRNMDLVYVTSHLSIGDKTESIISCRDTIRSKLFSCVE